MSKLTVTTIAGVTSGADANKVKIESGHTLESENVTVSGTSTFEKSISVGTTANLISNGDFTTNTTGWAATGSTLAISSGALQITPGSGVNGFANQQVDNLVVGRSYIASVVVTQDAGALSRLYIGTSANGNQNVSANNLGTGSHSFTFVATATTHHFALVVGGGTGQVTKFDAARLTEASRIIFPAVTGIAPEIKQGATVNDFAIATNQVNRLNIDANGNITMPSQPVFHVTRTSSQTTTGNTNASTPLEFPTSTAIVSSTHFNHTTHRFTAPVAGKYMFQWGYGTNSPAGQSQYRTFIWKNGAKLAYTQLRNDSTGMTGYNYGSRSAIVSLAASDYVHLNSSCDAGHAFYGDSELRIFFQGYLLA